MDFIYGQLPEIVDDMIYSPVPGNGTATVQIDNENKKIGVNVLKTPGTLKINNSKTSIEYNGGKDIQLNIPKYIIKRNNANSESTAYRWALFEYNFETQDYDINCGDIEVGEDKDILNLENGTSLDPSIPVNGAISSKDLPGIAMGSTAEGIQSFSFGGNDLAYPDSFQVIEIDNFNDRGEVIGKIELDLININSYVEEGTTYYDLTLKDRDTKQEATLVKVNTTDFKPYADIPFFAYSATNVHYMNYWAARFTNGSILEIGVVVNHIQQQRIYEEITYTYKAVLLISSANGNQSISVGKGTHADADQSQAFGLGTITCWPGQMVIGKYNIPIPEALFIIGNGVDEFHRSNALVVYADGTTETAKQIDVIDPTPSDGYNETKVVTMGILDNYAFDDGILYDKK